MASFLGIPYAEPPIGKLRFQPPRESRPWSPALLDATNFKADCMQSKLVASDGHTEDEDCLFLNIWTPAVRGKAAVMIFFHGGGWQLGGANRPEYYGDEFARRGIVVLSFNYRLGALGFLVSLR